MKRPKLKESRAQNFLCKATLTGAIALLGVTNPLQASPITFPTPFASGQTISSSQVNTLFSTIISEENNKDTRIAVLEAGPQILKPFMTPGTYTLPIPSGVTQALIEVIGAGGGGGGGNGCTGMSVGQNGGGGGYGRAVVPVSPGDTLSISVGNGGPGGGAAPTCSPSSPGGNGGAGGNTVVSNSSIWVLNTSGGGGGGGSPSGACSTPGLAATAGSATTSGNGAFFSLGAVPSPSPGRGSPGAGATPGSCAAGFAGQPGLALVQLY